MSETAVAAPPSGAPAETANTQTEGETPPAQATPANPLVWDAEAGDWVAKTKVDGKESVRKFSDLQKDAQIAKSSQQRFDEAKAIKRENAALAEKARLHEELAINPRKAMEAWAARGYDPKQVLAVLQADLEAEASLTPEQRERRELQAKVAKYEAEERARQESDARQKEEQAESAETERMERMFHKHMDAQKLPVSPKLRGHVATLLWALHDNIQATGGEPISASEGVAQAYSELKDMAKEIFAALPPDERLAMLGADAVTKAQRDALAGAAPLPKSAASHQPRSSDGKFSRFTVFSNARSFSEALDRAERK